MPAWGIHLTVAQKINEKLGLPVNDFLLGNVLPDALNGYIVKNITNFKSYNDTHYIKVDSDNYVNLPKLPDYYLFINKYKDKLNKPMILGYLVHLMTDYYFNKEVINKYITLGVTVDFNKVKQIDFEDFELELIKRGNKNLIYYDQTLYEKCNELIEINNNEIKEIIMVVHNKYFFTKEKTIDDILIPKEELYQIYMDCIHFIIEELIKMKIIDNIK